MDRITQAKRYIEARWPDALYLQIDCDQFKGEKITHADIGGGIRLVYQVSTGTHATIVSYDVLDRPIRADAE